MRIFVIPAIYPTSDKPNLGCYIKEQCVALNKYFAHDIVVLNSSARNYKDWKLCNKSSKTTDSTFVVYSRLTKGFMLSRFPKFAIQNYFKNVKIEYNNAVLEIGKPDVIYAHFSFPSGYSAFKLSKEEGVPYVVEEHYSLYLRNISDYIASITKTVILNSSSFICVSDYLRNSIYKHTGLNSGIDVIPNMIDDIFRYRDKKEKKEFIFFSAGNFYKSKGFALLIEAFTKAFDKNDNVKLKIAGDGPQKELIYSLIKKYDRMKQIELLGNLNRKEMFDCYTECDTFVLLSEYETFGIVYREALAVGRPVISTRNGGIQEGWDSNFGILINNGSLDEAVEALKTIRKTINKYNNKNISKISCEKHSAEVIAAKINEKLLNAYNSRNSAN